MSITVAVRSLNRATQKRFPGSSTQDVAVYLRYVFEAAAQNLRGDYKETEALAHADTQLAEAADRDEAWAVNLRDAVLVNVIKPIVDKAAEKGVDPVTALVLNADLTEDKASEYVAILADRDADSDSADTDDEPVAEQGDDEDEADDSDVSTVSVGASY